MAKSTKSKNNNKLIKRDTEETKKDTLVVNKPIVLDFLFCEVTDYPTTAVQFKKVIDTLHDMSDVEKFQLLHDHKLKNKGTGKNSQHVQNLVKNFPKLKSVDVGTRNGVDGDIRLLYFFDSENTRLAHIVNCFIDDH